MTHLQALTFIANCASKANLPAEVHDQWRAAFKMLNDKLTLEQMEKKELQKPEAPKEVK